MALSHLGLADRAAVFFQDLIREDPGYLPARNGLGLARLRQRRAVEARALLEEVVACWPDHQEAVFHLALAEFACGHPHEAEARLAAMIPHSSHAVEATRRLVSHYWAERRLAEAKAVLDRMLRGHPGQRDVIFLRATLLAEEGEFDLAAEELQELVATKPASMMHLLELVRVERARGRFAEAEEALARARAEGAPEDLEAFGTSSLDQLAADLAREKASGQRVNFTVREVRAILRGSKDRNKRLYALRQLASAQSRDVVRREVSDHLGDPDPEIRKAALHLLGRAGLVELEQIKAALADEDAGVRTSAAPVAMAFRGRREAVELMLASLQREEDAGAFRAIHDALKDVSGTSVFLEPGAETKDARRREIVDAWFERLAR
jgi:tetratricopeptide (TPR) repeat protein